MTVGIELGLAEGGAPALLDLEELLATRLLVQGNSGCGKSHLLRRLLERSAPWVQQAVIDPEGDFTSLAERFGHLVIDAAAHTEAELTLAGDRARRHRVSVVLDLEGLDQDGQLRRAAAFLNGLFDAPREHWTPLLVVVDEAQLFAPSGAVEVAEDARRAALGAMTNLMCRGRKRGLAGVIATQRLAKLAKNVAAEASNFLMGRTFLDIDMARAADLLGMERRQAEMFRDLARGHFMALGPALSRRPLAVRVGAVETESRGAGPSLTPLPEVPLADARAVILAAPPPEAPRPPRRIPAAPPPDILAQLAAARPAAPAEAPPPLDPEALAAHQRRLEAVMRAVLAEEDSAYRPVPVLYQDFLVRCRIQALSGPPPDLGAFRRMLAVGKAAVPEEVAAQPEWAEAQALAAPLPEDLQGVFLLLAAAALAGAPCPGDAAIARAYGTRSVGRARRALGFIEEAGLVVCRPNAAGRRIVAVVGVGWETAAGDVEA
ncbi:ATP-binding protein [Siccirubricoccus deserti]|uniref:ATP-binding protein n=1 Tax=Siccirubricoccus deserti TaxID=2013562 RepID=A0A9X0R1P3_9PROT|nr:ATP-binding protein [Siccirubricoccus deserti]MBC4017896.1 ATP-binding protein [Siccirubricoccus deserti]GGC61703.1 ATP-binding protein [Siccirubricoccus deserti]